MQVRGEYQIRWMKVAWVFEALEDKVIGSFECPVCLEKCVRHLEDATSDPELELQAAIRRHFIVMHDKQSLIPVRALPALTEEREVCTPGMPPLVHVTAIKPRVAVHKRLGNGTLVYFEAWMSDNYLVQHYGPINSRGTIPPRAWFDDCDEGEARALQLFAERIENGYAVIPNSDLQSVSLEYRKNIPASMPFDLIREDLSWSGLWGSQRVNVQHDAVVIQFEVVDAAMSVERVSDLLGGTEFAGYDKLCPIG